MLKNQLYQNCNSLFYIAFISAIKQGDIGCIVNVLCLWMVMMQSTATMPKYTDAIFESLAQVNTYEPWLKQVSHTLSVISWYWLTSLLEKYSCIISLSISPVESILGRRLTCCKSTKIFWQKYALHYFYWEKCTWADFKYCSSYLDYLCS